MGVLAYVNGLLTSFGNGSILATADADLHDLVKQLILEQRVTNELLRLGLDIDVNIIEIRSELSGDLD